MKIRDARAAADPPPDEAHFADDAEAQADDADEDFAEEAQLAADYDEVDDTEPVDAEQPDESVDPPDEDEFEPDEVEVVDEDEQVDVEEPDDSDSDIDVDDIAEEVPEEPELLAEDAVGFGDDEDTLPRDVAAPEEEALHEVDQDELLARPAEWRDRWDQVQLGFVDHPLDSVESAGRMVGEVLDEMARAFAARRREIEARWSEASQVSTDDLREVFLRYRELFNRVIV